MRVGIGFDAHRFEEGRKLVLGGVDIDFEKGLKGHSDADVILHALIDALLGAASLGNIGQLFPASDPQYKDISSLILLKKAKELLEENGYKIVNIDSIVILEEPRLENYWQQMLARISTTIGIDKEQIGLKAKTTEKMGFTGRNEGIAAQAVVLISKK